MSIGSIVMLKTGGPKMTILSTHTHSEWSSVRYWLCGWFEGTELKTLPLAAAALELVKQ